MGSFEEPTTCHIADEIYGLIFNLVLLTEKLGEWKGEKQPIAEEGTRHLPETVEEMAGISWIVSRFSQSMDQDNSQKQNTRDQRKGPNELTEPPKRVLCITINGGTWTLVREKQWHHLSLAFLALQTLCPIPDPNPCNYTPATLSSKHASCS